MKIIVALCGASGIEYGIQLLKELKEQNIEVNLIVSKWAEEVMKLETLHQFSDIQTLATHTYRDTDMKASIASSSFLVDGMVIIPATIKTCSEIANANCSNLTSRAADNMLKCKKPLIICPRETPLSTPALKVLHNLSLYGAIVLPLMPAFYHKPKKLQDIYNFITGKILDLLGIKNKKFKRWGE